MVGASGIVPAISVVMPLYNKAEQVIATIESVRAQHFTNWEMVVVNDGSTDDGCARVSALADPRIRIIQQSNQGVSAARNTGIQAAKSDLIAFLDADDEWLPDFLEAITRLVADYPEAAWYATGYRIERSADAASYPVRLYGLPHKFAKGILPNYFVVAGKSDPPVHSSAVVIRRSAILCIGGFPVGVASGEDLLTWAKLAVQYPLAYNTRTLAIFYVSGHDRKPDPLHRVGKALTTLSHTHPQVPGLRGYAGLWYRMQAVMALRFQQRAFARQFSRLSVFYAPLQWRNVYIWLLAWLPSALGKQLDQQLRKWKTS